MFKVQDSRFKVRTEPPEHSMLTTILVSLVATLMFCRHKPKDR